MFIHFLCMFVLFFCLCPLRLVIMLNFNIPKVAYCIPTAKTTCPQWPFCKWAKYKVKYKINIFTLHYLPSLVNISIESLVYIVLLYFKCGIKIISMFYTVEALVKIRVVTGAGCLQEYCSVPLVEFISSPLLKISVALRDELCTSNFITATGYKSITINFAH